MENQIKNAGQLAQSRCVPCEGGVEPYTVAMTEQQLTHLSGWRLTHDNQRIRKDWKVKDFVAGIDFFQQIMQVAETEQHHPDVHLESYRKLWVEIWTHAIGGLSENDFILAAKIDTLPVDGKPSA
ncbi:MAG: 4a-hydroxytetrahydrobiopterin dehydratase [Pirellulaceae bacterium]|nr:4a-hydroxytetrahydrobiopterin dehydratase [Bdellovibrionales bacterium]